MVATPRTTMTDPSDFGKAMQEFYSASNSITAFAGGGQTSATQLTRAFNRITTCATGGDSVKLPTALSGAQVVVVNRGAASCNVFPKSSEAINALANNTQLAVGIGLVAIFTCILTGKWEAGAPS